MFCSAALRSSFLFRADLAVDSSCRPFLFPFGVDVLRFFLSRIVPISPDFKLAYPVYKSPSAVAHLPLPFFDFFLFFF